MITAHFPVASCPDCNRDVALYSDLVGDQLRHRCLHCDGLLEPDTSVRQVYDGELRRLGYRFEDDKEEVFEGCGKENCNKGQCKNSGKPHPFSEQP